MPSVRPCTLTMHALLYYWLPNLQGPTTYGKEHHNDSALETWNAGARALRTTFSQQHFDCLHQPCATTLAFVEAAVATCTLLFDARCNCDPMSLTSTVPCTMQLAKFTPPFPYHQQSHQHEGLSAISIQLRDPEHEWSSNDSIQLWQILSQLLPERAY